MATKSSGVRTSKFVSKAGDFQVVTPAKTTSKTTKSSGQNKSAGGKKK